VQATTSIRNAPQWAITLEASRYIESGFEVYLRIPFMITRTPTGADTSSGSGDVFGIGGNLGVRYLFLEETIRPWVGVHLATTVLFTQPNATPSAGIGTTVGIDFFLNDFLSIGARGSYDLFYELNKDARHNFSAGLSLATIF